MNYKVYQGTELKQTVTSKTAVMNGLQPNRTYDFSVEADNGQPSASGKTAWARSSDGSDGFSNSYPGENLITRTGELANTMVGPNGNISVYGGSALMADKITVTPGEALTFSRWGDSVDNNFRYGFYTDADVSLIREYSTAYNFTVTVPANATKLKVSYPAASQVKLERGTIATPWYPSPVDDPINANPRYIGHYTNVAQASITNPSDYSWRQIRDGVKVTTRGIRFNIPKTLTVGSNITLRYEEYPLGIVPIGNEPSGMFGGGNKQNLSAKVISMSNGSSVAEVAGNVIEVGNGNLLRSSEFNRYWSFPSQATIVDGYDGHTAIHVDTTSWTSSGFVDVSQTIYNTDVQLIKQGEWYTISFYAKGTGTIRTHMYPSVIDVSAGSYADGVFKAWPTGDGMYDWPLTDKYVRHSWSFKTPTTITPTTNTGIMLFRSMTGNSTYVSLPKLEPGTIATPYASFVDGDTFTVQPDGTCALFSEHKALYY